MPETSNSTKRFHDEHNFPRWQEWSIDVCGGIYSRLYSRLISPGLKALS